MGLFSRVGKREEFPVSSEINALELHGFNGSVQWVPVDEEGARIVVEKEVRGLNAGVLDEVLEDLNVESTSSQGKLVLRAVNPRRSFGLFSVQVCFTVYVTGADRGLSSSHIQWKYYSGCTLQRQTTPKNRKWTGRAAIREWRSADYNLQWSS